jgi:hypothetical protein
MRIVIIKQTNNPTRTIIHWMIVSVILVITANVSARTHISQREFLNIVANNDSELIATNFTTKTLWLNKEIQSEIKPILNHKYPKLRLRYKVDQNLTTIWFLDEIGKERPITFGVAVKDNKIRVIRVLEFRESRGYEIKLPAFTKQFEEVSVDRNGKLDHNIDGITGATMSVRAMKKISRLALMLHKQVQILDNSAKKKL